MTDSDREFRENVVMLLTLNGSLKSQMVRGNLKGGGGSNGC